jgi:hypothetical protein
MLVNGRIAHNDITCPSWSGKSSGLEMLTLLSPELKQLSSSGMGMLFMSAHIFRYDEHVEFSGEGFDMARNLL